MGGRSGKKRRFSGQETVAAVEAALQADGTSRKAAFEQVAKETGRSANTIAVTYYRLKAKGAGRVGGRRGRRRGRPPGGTTGGIAKAIAALRIVGDALKQQQAELEKFTRESARVEQIRRLLG
jgi:hypothetical protein